MNIEEIPLKTLVALIHALDTKTSTESESSFWETGKNYFIRTVTHHFTGKLVAVTAQEIILEQAAWIPDDGRFAQAIESQAFNEVEPFPAGNKVLIGRASLIDATQIKTIPCSQK